MFDPKRLLAAFGPREARGAYARAVAALEAARFEDALGALAQAEGEAENAEALATARNKRGVALIGLGRRPEALEAFCAALAANERCAPALVNLGNLLLEDGHGADAIDYYEAAIRADEGYAVAYRNLGVACKRAGRQGDAVRYLRLADRLEARRPRGRA
jgi:tetratricopeptide (TPR) repeat protein